MSPKKKSSNRNSSGKKTTKKKTTKKKADEKPKLLWITTDDPSVGISDRFKGLHEFIERNPKLAPLAEDLLDRLSYAVPELNKRKDGWPCLLYLRSSFSTDLHPLFVVNRGIDDTTLKDDDVDTTNQNLDSPARLYEIARQNWFSGLHPLPQVLDALHGRMEEDQRFHVRVDIDFSNSNYNGMRAEAIPSRKRACEFDDANVKAGGNRVDKALWEYRHVLLRIGRDAFVDLENHEDSSEGKPTDDNRVFPKLPFGDGTHPDVRDFEIWKHLFYQNSPMSTALIAGAARLCALLRVPANLMMFRAVAGGVFSLWRYGISENKSNEDDVITTILCRPSNAAAVSAGVILLGPGPVKDRFYDGSLGRKEPIEEGPDIIGYPRFDDLAIDTIGRVLREWTWEVEDVVTQGRRTRSFLVPRLEKNPNKVSGDEKAETKTREPNGPEKENPAEAMASSEESPDTGTADNQTRINEQTSLLGNRAFSEIGRLLDINPGQPNPRYSTARVGEEIAKLAGMKLRPEVLRGLGHAICRLLERAILLSDTNDEGRPVAFGMMLGDPFHVRYWPGARPSPIVEPIGALHEKDKDSRRQHSLSIERLRARVEYVSDPRLRCIVFPYFAVYPRGGEGDNDPSYVIDLSEFGPSVASWPPSTLWSTEASTYAYLSAQCPGSIACLVGPGAHIRVFANGDMVAYRNSREWFIRQHPEHEIDAKIDVNGNSLKDIVGHLLQLGAAMSPFHNPDRHGGFIIWTEETKIKYPEGASLEQLHSGEPERLFGGSKWISGRRLLAANVNKKVEIDFPVAQQILKASERDGAVWLAGNLCTLKEFGMRVSLDSNNGKKGGGSNVGTKRRTAEDLVKAGKGKTIAVTVSSDGPIRLWYLPKNSHDVVPGDMFSAIETNQRDYH